MQASQRAVAYAATQLAQPGDTIHLLCVLLDTTLADDHFARRTYVSTVWGSVALVLLLSVR